VGSALRGGRTGCAHARRQQRGGAGRQRFPRPERVRAAATQALATANRTSLLRQSPCRWALLRPLRALGLAAPDAGCSGACPLSLKILQLFRSLRSVPVALTLPSLSASPRWFVVPSPEATATAQATEGAPPACRCRGVERAPGRMRQARRLRPRRRAAWSEPGGVPPASEAAAAPPPRAGGSGLWHACRVPHPVRPQARA
jgi:hypothetical protein